MGKKQLTRHETERSMLLSKQLGELLLELATITLEKGEGLFGLINWNGYEICNKADPHMVNDEMVKDFMRRKKTKPGNSWGFMYTNNAGKMQLKLFLE